MPQFNMQIMSYRDAMESKEWTPIEGTIGSDYSGTIASIANYRWFQEHHSKDSDLCAVYGDYGTYGIFIRTDCEDPDLHEVISAIQEHVVICDTTYHNVMQEKIELALDAWALDEFKREVQHTFGGHDADSIDLWYDVSDDVATRVFHACVDKSGEEWIDAGEAWIDLRSVVQSFYYVMSSFPVFA